MLKSILALIVSCALIGGTGAVPATPAAETRTVIENIVFSAGGDSVALDHALEFTAAAGSDAAEIGFELDKAGESILPMKAKITPEEFVFSIAEGGNAYSVSDEFIAEYFGGDTEDIAALTTMAEIIGALPQVLTSESHMGFAAELYNAISAHEGAQIAETDELITEGVTLHLENGAQYAFNDAMRESDTQYLSSFLQWDLKLGRLMDGVDYASYMEQYDGEASSDTYTMYRTSANGIDFGYRLSLDSMGEEGADHADIIFQPEYFYCSWTPEDPDNMEDPLSFSCSMDNGRVSEAYLSYGYREESVDTYGSDDEYADVYREAVYLDYDYTLEDGFGRHAFGLHVIMDSESLVDGEVVYTDSTDIMFDLSANGRAGENGGVVTGVEMDICVDAEYSGLDPTRFEMDIAFDVRTEAGAYADSFAGANIIAIENEDDIPPQMTGEGMMLASQLALLQYDEKIAALPALLEKAVTENVEKEEPLPGPVLDDGKAKKEKPSKPEIVLPDKTAEPSAQIDEGKMKKEKPVKPDIALPETPAINEDELKEKYGLDEPVIDVNAGKTAAEANSFPNLTPPAGYALDQIDDQGSEIFRTYLNAAGDMIDCHIDSTIDDISFGLPEGAAGTPVKLYYHDDGSVYGASFILEGFYFDIYANPGVSFEEMEAMIASIAF